MPSVAALPSSTSFTNGVNSVPMIPSPTEVISVKTRTTLSARDRDTVRAPSRHSDTMLASRPFTSVSSTSAGAAFVEVRISWTRNAASRNVTPSTSTTALRPPMAATTPPTEPPTSRATWATWPLRALAVSRPSSSTSSGSIAESAVATNTSTTEVASSTAYTIQIRRGAVDQQQGQQPDRQQQVADHHRARPRPAVHEHPGEQPGHHLRQERRQQRPGRRERRAGDVVHGVDEADREHPVAGHRDQPGGQQQAQVAVRAEQSADGGPRDGRGGCSHPRHHSDITRMPQWCRP